MQRTCIELILIHRFTPYTFQNGLWSSFLFCKWVSNSCQWLAITAWNKPVSYGIRIWQMTDVLFFFLFPVQKQRWDQHSDLSTISSSAAQCWLSAVMHFIPEDCAPLAWLMMTQPWLWSLQFTHFRITAAVTKGDKWLSPVAPSRTAIRKDVGLFLSMEKFTAI